MLCNLVINNFAIIDELSIDFENNLTVITGETGAGKSILLGALELVLGKRANHSVILNKEKKCSIEATFKVKKSSQVNDLLQQKEFEVFDDLIIRREISPNGRSRSFINDTPAKLEDLQLLGLHIIDLHKQFDSYELLQSVEQLNLLDTFLQLIEERAHYTATYTAYQDLSKELATKKENASKAKAEEDYLNFIYDEIVNLQLEKNTIEDWSNKYTLLENAQSIKETFLSAVYQISNSEPSIIEVLQSITKELEQHAGASKEIESLLDRLQSTTEELKDISAEFEIQETQIEHDDSKLTDLSANLELSNKLLLKHNVQSTADLIAIRENLSDQLENANRLTVDITDLEQKQKSLEAKCHEQAKQISKKRIEGSKQFVLAMNKLLPKLGFMNAIFDVEHNFTELGINGIDSIDFLFDANNRDSLQTLRKAVSGGEMSRIMLAIKSLLANKSDMPCLIFDEIDTGISGETALKVGRTLKELGRNHQVICITHLAQIAAHGKQHFYVQKVNRKKSGQTSVRRLNEFDRVEVLAQMLSGTPKSDHALQTAQELLESNK